MFYSQFILAKKGPLGTIWIAAHLERKLRKNQVADTDIGVSVDSILCPDVPIALRLSSHLLLGVVRIYSRKVNYLFHDCSEALLKIKQAFRSTAVDLPPEESTAPYHSITLPETFHLDDFELPESVFQGDFVDHHVSTKEQITLQDTIDGATFSTVQFGLDERFGDDSASHIGLDLDEELFLAKHSSVQHSSIILEVNERAGNQGQSSSAFNVTEMDIDGDQNGSVKNTDTEAPVDLFNSNNDNDDSISAMEEMKKNNLSSTYNIQTPDLNEVFSPNEGTHTATSPSGACIADDVPSLDPAECAHAPQTPGLVEEGFLANKHESPALSPQRKLSPALVEEAPKLESCNMLSECPESMTVNGPSHVVTMDQQQTEQLTIPDETQMECRQKNVDVDDKLICTEMSILSVDGQDDVEGEVLLPEKTQMEGMEHDASNNRILLDESLGNAEGKLKTYNSDDLPSGLEANACNTVTTAITSDFHLRPCTSDANLGNGSFAEDGTSVNVSEGPTEDLGVQSEVPITEKALDGVENLVDTQGKGICMENATDSRVHESGYTLTTDVPLVDLLQKDIQQLNCSSISEFLEPEKMLLAPSGSDNIHLVNEISQVTAEKKVTESDESNRISSLSGKKRHLLESSVLETDTSAKLAGRPRVRRNTEHILDDDDLLSSILGAKRTPLLQVGPTPTKSAALKRQKLISSLGRPKRKVLVDDTTVLHADAIRQQLINTEDIRRVRKKAPCTRPEIWLIQKSSLDEEVFDEPIFTGISDELNALYTQTYDTEFLVVANDSEKLELPSIMPVTVDGETQEPCSTPILLEALNETGTGERSHAEIMLDDVSHNTCPLVETSDNQQQLLNSMDLTNDQFSDIKDSSTLHFTEIPSEEFHDTTIKPEGIDASLLLDGPPKVSPVVSSINDVLVSSTANNLHEDEEPMAMVTDVSTFLPNTNFPLGDAIESGDAADLMAASGPKVTDGDVYLDTEVLSGHAEQKCYDAENHNFGIIDPEGPEKISISLSEQNPENGQIPLAIGETSGLQEFNVDGGAVVESTAMDSAMVGETNDFYSTIDGNDTGFLNVDDEAEYEEAVNDMPSNEDAQSLENSGWSSRTRGVARYLKILFDEETGQSRKTVAMDHLIAGKSRKEASRMFFETLVLKTKDFIHVEQETPFGYITVEPRGKLLKSEF